MSASAITPTVASSVVPFLNQTQPESATQTANNAATTAATAATSANAIGGNFNTFIQILTTQLQYQDPTDAADTNQFTQELVEFAGVEQQLNTNSLLQQIATASGAGGVKSVLGYVGQYVEVPADNQMLVQNGQANVSYTLPSAAQNVTLSVTDSTGATVATISGPTASGVNNLAWNAEDSSGDQLPDGVYTLAVSATDANGNALTVSNIGLIGQVTGVQTADSNGNDLMLGPNLTVDDANISAVFPPGSVPSAASTTTNTNTNTPTS